MAPTNLPPTETGPETGDTSPAKPPTTVEQRKQQVGVVFVWRVHPAFNLGCWC
jgi:hypothetical protein